MDYYQRKSIINTTNDGNHINGDPPEDDDDETEMEPMNDFESWLWSKFEQTDGQGMSKDWMVDAFDSWLENIDIDTWIEYGQEYKDSK